MGKEKKCSRCGKLLLKKNCYSFEKGYCKTCWKFFCHRYYEKNKEKIKKRVCQYCRENKEKINLYHKIWIRKHKEEHKKYHRKWYKKKRKENPLFFIERRNKIKDWKREYTRKYRKKNRAWNLEQKHKRRCRENNGRGLTEKDIFFLLEKQKGKCFYCQKDISSDYTVDHLKPLCKGGKNEIDNCVLACLSCNVKKGRKSVEEAGKYFELLKSISG